ncbi:MAG TPA: LPS export ABC transporter periplasmic protein LptC [Bacteroidales bacterium]|nr:LPS export ABC transporter periplasmic protein LptC [Bacteroidales bacterium]
MSFPAKYKIHFIALISLIGTLLISCEKRANEIPKSDLLSMPSLSAKNFETVFTDSGKVQLILSSPLMEQYDNKETPYTEFRKGIKVTLFKGIEDTVGEVTAKYAKYTQKENLWELKDSVVVINKDHDKLETELLYWNEDKDLIYTDRFVKISSTDQIIQGYGFESDTHLEHRKIKKVSATIYLDNEE